MASSTLVDHRLTLPNERSATQAGVAADILKQFLSEHPDSSDATVRLVADTADTTVKIPGEALTLLADVLAQIASGNAVTIAPVHAELTTQQAADLLGVSRPYLVKLLEERKIPHRRVGNRRRVMLTDLVAYKRIADAERLAIADELTAEAQRLGLYT
mgnify:FL=1